MEKVEYWEIENKKRKIKNEAKLNVLRKTVQFYFININFLHLQIGNIPHALD